LRTNRQSGSRRTFAYAKKLSALSARDLRDPVDIAGAFGTCVLLIVMRVSVAG
jgi:hypothetical protein